MVGKETSIAEKIIKNFLHGSIALNKKFKRKKPDIQFKDLNFTVKVDEGNHEDYDTDDEKKKREDMFKRHNFKIIRCNPNGPGEINSFQAKKILTSQNYAKKMMNEVINEIAEDFEKAVVMTKSKE